METRAAAALALVGVGGVCVAALVLEWRQRQGRRHPEQVEPELEADADGAAALERERWLGTIGVQWFDGRAPAQHEAQMDVIDLAVELANFASEVGHEANGQGGCVDRKPHKQRMSADFGGPMHDGVRRPFAPFELLASTNEHSSDQRRLFRDRVRTRG